MLLHLKGRVHRQAWVDKKFRGNVDMVELSQAELKAKAKEMDERKDEEERVRRGEPSAIETIYSDEAFPWPAGKAPWLKENGGTGLVPEGALEKFGVSSRCRQISVAAAEEEFKTTFSRSPTLPDIRSIQEPRSTEEAKQMLALAESMIATVVESNQLNLREREVMMMKAGAAALNLKLGKDVEEQGFRSKRPNIWGNHYGS